MLIKENLWHGEEHLNSNFVETNLKFINDLNINIRLCDMILIFEYEGEESSS